MPQAKIVKCPWRQHICFSLMAISRTPGARESWPAANSRFALRANLVSSRPVQSLATPQKPAGALPVFGRRFSARLALPLLFFGALWFVLCKQLSGEWLVNEQHIPTGGLSLSLSSYLFWLRWQDRPPAEISDFRFQKSNPQQLLAILIGLRCCLLFPVRLFEIASPEWRPPQVVPRGSSRYR